MLDTTVLKAYTLNHVVLIFAAYFFFTNEKSSIDIIGCVLIVINASISNKGSGGGNNVLQTALIVSQLITVRQRQFRIFRQEFVLIQSSALASPDFKAAGYSSVPSTQE